MRQLYSFYTDAFWIAVKSILEHKLRALLTLIGIIIGVLQTIGIIVFPMMYSLRNPF